MQIVSVSEVAQRSDCLVVPTFLDLIRVLKDRVVDVVLLPENPNTTLWIGDQVQAICSIAPLAGVVVLGNHPEGTLIFELLEAGARGYLFSGDNPPEHLDTALRTIQSGKIYLSPIANAEYLKAIQSGCWEWWLTPQTRTVLKFITEGKTISAIAELMQIKTWTVYKLLKRIRQRFDVNTNAAAISQAMAQGYVRVYMERPQ